MTKIKYGFLTGEDIINNLKKVCSHRNSCKDVFPLKFLDIKKIHPKLLEDTNHQICVLYKNGKMEILPNRVFGDNQLREFLGVRYYLVTHWAVLPIAGTPEHIFHYNSLNGDTKRNVLRYD